MNAKLNLGAQSSIMTLAAAALAGFVAISMLSSVVGLFQSRGAPMERLAAAERACVSHNYHSGRAACMKQWIAGFTDTSVAAK